MQTTLLGLAVAIILALVAALVGPLFVDWGRWRTTFEAEATRLVGMPVRFSGRIDARLLPTPSLLLNDIAIGEPGREPKLRARTLGVEFALGSLLRGQWRAARLHLDAPQVTLGLDAQGRIDVPQMSIGFDPDQLSFESVDIENGRAVLLHAASDTRVVLDQLWFKGEIRSLLGPFKGEGAFVSSGQLYGYRVAGSRRGEDGGMRLRLSIDPSDRPLTVDTDGTVYVERDSPRYEGSLVLARPAGFELSSGKTQTNEPWRATSRINITAAGALLQQLDFQYGPDERAIKLAGTAEFKFGAKSRFKAELAARQIDLDRALLRPDAARRTPLGLLGGMTETFGDLARPNFPVEIGIGVDAATLAGGSLIALRGDLRAEGGVWSVDTLEFRAPGATQVRASGRLTLASGSAQFVGPARVDSADPKSLIAWLEGRPEAPRASIGALRARGDVTLGADRLAVDGLTAEFDRKSIEGRLAYVFAAEQRPPRLDAALTAAEIDLDGAIAFASNALAGTTFERPGEIALALDFGRATYAGIEARGATANLKFDAGGLVIERLAVADFGGAVLDARGRIDMTSPSPRGSISLSLQAQKLTAVAALAARFAPGAADLLRAATERAGSAKLTAKLDVAPSSAAQTSAKLTVGGAIAGVQVKIDAQGSGSAAAPAAANIQVDGRLDAEDGTALAALFGFDRLAVVEPRPAHVILNVRGPAGRDLRVAGSFNGIGLDARASGTLSFADAHPRGVLDVAFTAADARLPRRERTAAMPTTFGAHIAIDGEQLAFDRLGAKVAGATVRGRIALALGHPARVDGQLDVDAIDAGAVIAAAIGTPGATRAGTPLSPEPFAPGPLADVEGQIAFSVGRAEIAEGIAKGLRGIVRIEPSVIKLEQVQGRLAEGNLAVRAEFRTEAAGLATSAQVALVNADLAALLGQAATRRAAGRVSLQFDASGTGRSPAALIGALQGRGTATIENLQIAGFSPLAITAATRAAERGVSPDAIRIGDIVRAALDNGPLNIPAVGGAIALGGGRVTFGPLSTQAQGADVEVAGGYDATDDSIDLRFGLIGALSADAPNGQRPRLSIVLKGPRTAPQRTIDASALANWLAMRNVEQEARRLEAAERDAKRIQAQEEEARRRAQEAAQRRAEEAAQQRAEQTVAPRATEAPAFDRAPTLPPTIDITSPPGAAAKPKRTTPPPERATRARPPGAPLIIAPLETR